MEDETTVSSEKLHILLDISKRNDIPFPVVSKRITFTLTERQFPIKQSRLDESNSIVLEFAQGEYINGALMNIENIDVLSADILKITATAVFYVAITKRIDWNGYFTGKVAKCELAEMEKSASQKALLTLLKERLEKVLIL